MGERQPRTRRGRPAPDGCCGAVGRRDTRLRHRRTPGRDEFVVLAEGDSLAAGSPLVAQRLLDVLREPFMLPTIEGQPTAYRVSASIGIADGDRPQADDLLRDADLALYQAKAADRNRYAVFDAGMHTAVQDRGRTGPLDDSNGTSAVALAE